MFPEHFALIEAIASAFLAVLIARKYIQHRKHHHLMWMFFLIFGSAFELGVFLHFIHGSSLITEKIVLLLNMPTLALSGLGMLFLLRGFELFPKLIVQKPWPRYFLVYILIVYSALIGAVLIGDAQQIAITSSWILLIIPGGFITISGSISSFFLGRRRNLLIAIGLFLGIIGEQIGMILWHSGANWIDTSGEILMGIGFLIAMEPPVRKAGKKEGSYF